MGLRARLLAISPAVAIGVPVALLAVAIVGQLPTILGPADAEDRWEALAGAVLGVLTLLSAGAVLALAAVPRPLAEALVRGRALAALAFAAIAFVLAHDLTWDSYYAPDDVRYIDNGPIGPLWLVFLAACAAVTLATRRRSPSGALLATAGLLWLCAVSAFLVQAGH